MRGFSDGVAKWDMGRPWFGNLGAGLIFGLVPGLEYSTSSYLLTSLGFKELWSGLVEGVSKYKNKKTDRLEEFTRIFSLHEYKVPDPAATAAINLAYLLNVKTLADETFRRILEDGRVGGRQIAPVLRQITDAMFDDQRIRAAADFIFPVVGQKVYRDRLVEEFEINRRAYEIDYSLAYRRAADPFEQKGITVAGLEYIPVVLREAMATAAVNAGIKYLVVESPLSTEGH
jgi:hypothetical protein